MTAWGEIHIGDSVRLTNKADSELILYGVVADITWAQEIRFRSLAIWRDGEYQESPYFNAAKWDLQRLYKPTVGKGLTVNNDNTVRVKTPWDDVAVGDYVQLLRSSDKHTRRNGLSGEIIELTDERFYLAGMSTLTWLKSAWKITNHVPKKRLPDEPDVGETVYRDGLTWIRGETSWKALNPTTENKTWEDLNP